MSIEQFIKLRDHIEANLKYISSSISGLSPDVPTAFNRCDESELLVKQLSSLVSSDTQERVKKRLEEELRTIKLSLAEFKWTHRRE